MPRSTRWQVTRLLAVLMFLGSGSAAAAPAGGGLDAALSAAFGWWHANGPGDWHGNAYLQHGRLAYTTENGWGGQIDLGGLAQDYSNSSWSSPYGADLVTHLYRRSSGGLIGLMYQNRGYYFDHSYTHTDETFVGVEGQMYLDRMTLQGQVGSEEFNTPANTYKGYFVTGRVNYFVHDNLRFDGGLAVVHDGTAGYGYNQRNFELGVEYRFRDTPFSVFAEWTRIHEEDNYGWDLDSDFTLIGARVNIGQSTLLETNRSGAGLAPAPRVILW